MWRRCYRSAGWRLALLVWRRPREPVLDSSEAKELGALRLHRGCQGGDEGVLAPLDCVCLAGLWLLLANDARLWWGVGEGERTTRSRQSRQSRGSHS